MVAQVPFVDVVTTMLDESIPLTTGEYDEWGNPNEPRAYEYIRSYSPYDNMQPVTWPHLLVMTGLHDSQVQYWEPAKWVAQTPRHAARRRPPAVAQDEPGGRPRRRVRPLPALPRAGAPVRVPAGSGWPPRAGSGRRLVTTADAVAALRRADPVIRRLIDGYEPFAFRRTERHPFEALLRAIVHQQLSGRAAGAIYARVAALFDGERPTPRALAVLTAEQLRAAGLSRAKTVALHDLADKTRRRIVPGPRTVRSLSDDEIIERVVQVRGVGRWTGEMLLMHLGRPDVLPATDLGIRRGFARARGLDALPEPAEVLAYGARWRPWRSVASLYLWRAADLSAADLPAE